MSFQDFLMEFVFSEDESPQKRSEIKKEETAKEETAEEVYAKNMAMKDQLVSALGIDPKTHDLSKPVVLPSGVTYYPPGTKPPEPSPPPVPPTVQTQPTLPGKQRAKAPPPVKNPPKT